MAKRENEEQSVATAGEKTVLSTPLKIRPVMIVDLGVEVGVMEGLPAEFARCETLSGFPPSPKWEQIGDALFGYFVTLRDNVGPNASRLYEIAIPQKDGEPKTIALWGSAAIDRLFDSAFPKIKTGDKLGVIYCGEKATKRGLNPVKLFALKVARVDGKTTTGKAA